MNDELKKLKEELAQMQEDHWSMWVENGSELCVGEMVKKEKILKDKIKNMETNKDIVFFWSGPLSQWHSSPINYDGLKFNTAEQFMMYHKALVMEDSESAAQIMLAKSPREQKALGRQIKNFDLAKWDLWKEHIVYTANYLKFTQNEELYEFLMDTGDKMLVEASPEDPIWGIFMSEEEARNTPPENWKGLNLLGKAIMKVRKDLKNI